MKERRELIAIVASVIIVALVLGALLSVFLIPSY